MSACVDGGNGGRTSPSGFDQASTAVNARVCPDRHHLDSSNIPGAAMSIAVARGQNSFSGTLAGFNAATPSNRMSTQKKGNRLGTPCNISESTAGSRDSVDGITAGQGGT